MITPSVARMLIQEHLYAPLQGKVLTLGRQAIAMTHDEAVGALCRAGVKISPRAKDLARAMTEEATRGSPGTGWITDRAFFLLLGVEDLVSLDISDYEGCDIVHNLNLPIPQELENRFDFIIDGGTFDHLVDLRVCFQNVVRMLKPEGRVFQWNASSNFTGAAYLSFGPDLFHDFYVINHFRDCKVYIAEGDEIGQLLDWDLYFLANPIKYGHFRSPRIQMVLVIAEKCDQSTWDRQPVQSQYRPAAMAEEYVANIQRCHLCARPVWQGDPPLPTDPKKEGLSFVTRAKRFLPRRLRELAWSVRYRLTGLPGPAGTPATVPWSVPQGFRYVGRL